MSELAFPFRFRKEINSKFSLQYKKAEKNKHCLVETI